MREPSTPLARRLATLAAERPLPMSEFMTVALYDPDLGYYARGPEIGADGDFFTAASLPGFAWALARAVREAWVALDRPTELAVVEVGAGTGDLAVDLAREIAEVGVPARYVCVEPSPGLAARQRARGIESVPDLARVGRPAAAVAIANEVVDALPAHRVRATEDGLEELFVTFAPERGFAEKAGPLSTPALADALAGVALEPGQVVEASLLLGPLLRALAGAMHRGYAFFVDYGDERPRIHDEGRRDGTLRAFHRHAVASDVFLRIGEQDLTWSVDFTALAEAAEAAGFDVAGLVPQGEFLVNLGLVDYHARLAAQDPLAALRVKTLFLPGGMGESVKVLALAKGAPPRLPAVRRSYR